ncbi:POK18 protein, partial [Piprites chloris]|nr:POK18 protein [Piprites chloris]
VQKLAGTINWLCPYLGLTPSQIQPLIDLLKGDSDLRAPRKLTPQAKQTIALVEQCMETKQVWSNATDVAIHMYILIESMVPFAMIAQWNPAWHDPMHVL